MINNLKEFKEYVLDNKVLLTTEKGDCNSCHKRNTCRKTNRKKIIDDILATRQNDTRFSVALLLVKKYPALLNAIPTCLYEKMYGFFTDYLPCPFASADIIINLNKIEKVYDSLTDDISKKIFIHCLMYRVTLDNQYLNGCVFNEQQYFIEPYCNLGSKEIVVDCGGYIGDTIIDYFKYNSPPQKYYIYEPDDDNIPKIHEAIRKFKNGTEFVISNKGLYNDNAKLWFVNGNGSSSYASLEPVRNASEISVVSIDNDIRDDVSFIKMDIEGFEQKALDGCVRHIASSYPKLAICIYHSINDMWEIPFSIINNYHYKHYTIRHYSDSFRESVFYAYD